MSARLENEIRSIVAAQDLATITVKGVLGQLKKRLNVAEFTPEQNKLARATLDAVLKSQPTKEAVEQTPKSQKRKHEDVEHANGENKKKQKAANGAAEKEKKKPAEDAADKGKKTAPTEAKKEEKADNKPKKEKKVEEKAKPQKQSAPATSDSDESEEEEAPSKPKSNKKQQENGAGQSETTSKTAEAKTAKNDYSDIEGFVCDLGGFKLVRISSFKNTPGVDFRLHYLSEGKLKPSQKGIRLSLREFNILLDHANQIKKSLSK